jgi:hypothetical protein
MSVSASEREIATFCKCACANCGEVIEYLAGDGGKVIVCPQCKERSVLPEVDKLVVMEVCGPAAPEFKKCPACGTQTQFWTRACPTCERARRRKALATRLVIAGAAAVIVVAAVIGVHFHVKAAEKKAELAATTIPAASRILFEQPRPRQPKSTNDIHPGKFYIERRRGSDLILAVGDILNDSENVHHGLRADLDILDKNGAKIGSVTDYFTEIGPHQSWHFLATVTETNAMSVRFAAIKEDQ